jgi:hypothetical protein
VTRSIFRFASEPCRHHPHRIPIFDCRDSPERRRNLRFRSRAAERRQRFLRIASNCFRIRVSLTDKESSLPRSKPATSATSRSKAKPATRASELPPCRRITSGFHRTETKTNENHFPVVRTQAPPGSSTSYRPLAASFDVCPLCGQEPAPAQAKQAGLRLEEGSTNRNYDERVSVQAFPKKEPPSGESK